MITKAIMKQYRFILLEQPDLERRMKKISEQLERLEAEGTVVDTVSGGNGGTQHFRIEGFPAAEYSEKRTRLMSQKLRHEANERRIAEIEAEVCAFIDSIEDSRDRLIFRYYFEDGMSQQEIGEKLHIDQTLVGKRIDRYF